MKRASRRAAVVCLGVLLVTVEQVAAEHEGRPLGECGAPRKLEPQLAVPVRWCVVGNATPRVGAPAFVDPTIVEHPATGTPTTEDVLWRRHERASDRIYIPQVGITFRSGIADPQVLAGKTFPDIPDRTFPLGDPLTKCGILGCYGDVLFEEKEEFKDLVNLCQEKWNELLQGRMTDTGLMAINVRRILGGLQGGNIREPFAHGVAVGPEGSPAFGMKRIFLEDNAFNLDISTHPERTSITDPRDRVFAHEAGHAFPAALRHTGPISCRDSGEAGRTNLMNPVGLLSPTDEIDPSGDGHADVCALGTVQQEPTTPVPCPVVNQVTALRQSMNMIFGAARLDQGNVFTGGRSTVATGKLRDIGRPVLDINLSFFTEPAGTGTTILRHELLGEFAHGLFDAGPLEYFWMVDLDHDASTGVSPSFLGLPTSFAGAELVARVQVSERIIEVAGSAATASTFSAVPTVWRAEGGYLVEVADPGINARLVDTSFIVDRIGGGSLETFHPDGVMIEIPNAVRGARADAMRMQGLSRGGTDVDKLDDRPAEPGKELHMTPPEYPLCTVSPNPARLDDTLTVSVTGLLPNKGLHVLLGPNEVAKGTSDAVGSAQISFGMPFVAHAGGNLVTIGNDNTALTADCIADVVVPPECLSDTTRPVFDFVPPSKTISTCARPDIGQARASDACGVKVTNDAPLIFPLGTTTVTWTARDRSGNQTRATQSVTAVLGDDRSCCPIGTHLIEGTANAETLIGTAGPDCMLGKGGNDTLVGLGGNDFIAGGAGNDILRGDDGDDSIFGGSGLDILAGMAGSDTLRGGDHDDQLNGGIGNDRLLGEAGNDQLNGETGDDLLDGGSGTDSCQGGGGSDQLRSCNP